MNKYKLSEIVDFNISSLKKNDGVREIEYLDTSSLIENQIFDIQLLKRKDAPSRAQRKVKNNTILYSTVRPNQKHFGILKNPSNKLIVSTGFATIDIRENFKNKIDPDFLFLLLSQDSTTNYLQIIAQNSVSSYPSINPSDIGNIKFIFPDTLAEQKRIAKVLTDIDSKIALNKKINKELETMAKEIYDYWFVQFDFPNAQGKPYKSSGGKMVYNPLLKREIPEGWEVKEVEDIISPIERGLSYTSKEIENLNGIPMMNLACFDKAGNYRTGELKYFSGKYSDEDLLKPLDILIACTDLTQKADIIGTPIFVPCENSEFVYSTDLAKLVPLNNDDKFYLYYYLKNDIFHSYIKPFASGTTVKHLDVKGVLRYPYIQPNEKIVKNFSSFIEPVRKEISRLQDDNVKLTTLRNELLPLLMNGQVSVKE